MRRAIVALLAASLMGCFEESYLPLEIQYRRCIRAAAESGTRDFITAKMLCTEASGYANPLPS